MVTTLYRKILTARIATCHSVLSLCSGGSWTTENCITWILKSLFLTLFLSCYLQIDDEQGDGVEHRDDDYGEDDPEPGSSSLEVAQVTEEQDDQVEAHAVE